MLQHRGPRQAPLGLPARSPVQLRIAHVQARARTPDHRHVGVVKRCWRCRILVAGRDGGGGSRPGGGGGSAGAGDGENGGRQQWPVLFVLLAAGGSIVYHLIASTQCAAAPHQEVSIIVPVLNESKCIAETLRHLRQLEPPPSELLVVDGGSSDDTARRARRGGARVISSERGRARQMNAGAAAAKGDVLMFVHADSRPPLAAVAEARAALRDPGVVLGGFTTVIEHEGRTLWFATAHQFVSTYYGPLLFAPLGFLRGLRCMFGDQSLFCRAADFRRVGGFDAALPIMEDADLCVRLHERGLASGRCGRELQLRAVNRTSGRRIAPWGNLRSTVVQMRLALAWRLGAAPQELWRLYERLYTDAYR